MDVAKAKARASAISCSVSAGAELCVLTHITPHRAQSQGLFHTRRPQHRFASHAEGIDLLQAKYISKITSATWPICAPFVEFPLAS